MLEAIKWKIIEVCNKNTKLEHFISKCSLTLYASVEENKKIVKCE